MKPIAFAQHFLRVAVCASMAWTASMPPLSAATMEPARPETARAVGGTALGGPFTLTDHTGRTVTDDMFRGQYMLVYFGYMSCADICPTDISNMTAAMDLLGPLAKQIQPLFISVDPKRDTVEQLAEYVGLFHPRLIGLTGTKEQIDKVAASYLVTYFLFDSEDSAEYEVAHTAKTFLMAPDGRYLMWFRNATAPSVMASGIRRMMEKWSNANHAE